MRRPPALAAALGLALVGCRPSLGVALGPAHAVVRRGPERTRIDYDDALAADKRALLERINRDRAAAGVPPVRYEPRAALVGDRFCFDAARAGSWGHWDVEGRAPYLRWALAGGVDYESENVAAYTVSSGRIDRPLRDLLFESHDTMMAERPPHDGHRRTILDPLFTHVGIGMAAAGGEFRMTEEFTRVAFEWIELPAGPLRPGDRARFAGLPLPGWEVDLVEIRFEPPPHALSVAELRRRGSYRLPPVVQTLRPRLPEGGRYETGDRGQFPVEQGRVEIAFPVEQRGHYFVVCYLRTKGGGREAMSPGTIALVTAS
jgi:cysteine-rich secretory family protein